MKWKWLIGKINLLFHPYWQFYQNIGGVIVNSERCPACKSTENRLIESDGLGDTDWCHYRCCVCDCFYQEVWRG